MNLSFKIFWHIFSFWSIYAAYFYKRFSYKKVCNLKEFFKSDQIPLVEKEFPAIFVCILLYFRAIFGGTIGLNWKLFDHNTIYFSPKSL